MDEDETIDGLSDHKRFQRENVYNKMLPYADKLEEEATKLFSDIKTNLVKAVLAREMRPACSLWTTRLNKYLKVYGLKFSKEDHIALIKLYCELLTIPNLEPVRINSFASTLTILLKKKHLISRDELQLQWRPLYQLCDRIVEHSKTDIGMYRYFSTLVSTIHSMIRCARIYFPASDTQEIFDEFRPKLCPFNNMDVSTAVQYLELFLPLYTKSEEASISYDLWFDELMTFWDVCNNSNGFENVMTWLMARLSNCATGYINWEPYIPLMFVRFLRTLSLPVAFKQRQSGKKFDIDIHPMAVWIVGVLNGDNNSGFTHLEKFMQTLESYFYPANTGRWSAKLRELLCKLSLCLVQRVHFERYKKNFWHTPIPDAYKLTDEDIDRFVNILKPCVEQALFSRQPCNEVGLCLQYLASLRPNVIIPMIIDKLYASTDSLTEPHKMLSLMKAGIAVARHMVKGTENNYPEGPTHVIPLLMALLPGIDPNDMRKCFVTFNYVAHFVNMVPLVNSSGASVHYSDLTEEEHIICEASANFEDFVLQFFDRIFIWIDSSSVDFVRLEQNANSNNSSKSLLETMTETAIVSVITTVLYQCSPELFTNALRKVFKFVTEKVLEIQVAGKLASTLCNCFAKVNPKETLKLFIPYFCELIENMLNEYPNIQMEEHPDDEFLYNFQLLSEVVDGRDELVPYMNRLMAILDKTLHMSSTSASNIASRMLEEMITSLTYIIPTEFRSTNTTYETPLKDNLTVREWGKTYQLKDVKMSWYVPGEKELTFIQLMINKYLVPELEKLTGYANGQIPHTREELRRRLKIVVALLSAQVVMPIWDEPALSLVDSVLEPWAFNLVVSNGLEVKMPDGRNVRKAIAEVAHQVQKKILEVDEGDTKSVQAIIHIYSFLLFNKSGTMFDFEYQWKSFHAGKKLIEDKLHRKKMHLRRLFLNRVLLQHNFRNECRNCSFTETHRQILLNLFALSVSRYSENRISAQQRLFKVVSYYPYSYTVLIPKIIEILQMNTEENHEMFKGCLHILVGPKSAPIAARHNWGYIRDVWPLIVKSMPSEKPSIVNLMTSLSSAIHRYFPTITIDIVIPQSCLDAAKVVAKDLPNDVLESLKMIESSSEKTLEDACKYRRKAYTEAIDELLNACISKNLHWRYHSIAIGFIRDLVHCDVKYNSKVIKFFLESLIDESLSIRKMAMKVVLYALIQNKPHFKKIEIDPFKFSDHPPATEKLVPGIRPDNEWLLYNSSTVPKTAEEWEQPRYVHDQHIGFYSWPKPVKIYAPSSEQLTVNKRLDQMTDAEEAIYTFFSNQNNLEQLIKYLSMEEKKGKDQFNAYRFLVFKNVFKIFEDEFLDVLMPHLQKLVGDKQEASQRCASEILGGIIRGSKHWSYDKVARLWSLLLPVLATAISNMSEETVTDWGLCVAMALHTRDPNRHHWILEYLVDSPLSDPTSIVTCNRLYLLYTALNQQPWRNSELNHRLLRYLEPHLSHPFQNIRERISTCLSAVFSKDIVFPKGSHTSCPRVKDFFDHVMPRLNVLYKHTLNRVGNGCSGGETPGMAEPVCQDLKAVSLFTESERESAVRLFKIVCKYVTCSVVVCKTSYSVVSEYYQLVPLVCVLQSNDVDEELNMICTNFLAVLAQSLTSAEHIPAALDAIKKVAHCPFWSARALIMEFMSVFIFHNMALLISQEEWVKETQMIVLLLLEDVQPEVRVSAADVLSGLLHCKFVQGPMDLLKEFKKKARSTLARKSHKSPTSPSTNNNNIRVRHAGVLGLCAFISCHPYDVPDYLPDIFGLLGPHLGDPQPIPATIRKTLGDFKRTHHDNWEEHKLKFTEEELLVLSDLTVPPSYYA